MWNIRKLSEDNYAYMVKLRREFHMNPELSFKEFETSKRIIEELEKMGVECKKVLDTGVVAVIRCGRPGKVVALRADIDALEIKELSGVEYESKNEGIMHACGHDMHTASLLGAIRIINEIKDELSGTVKFIFQPGEETVTGAFKMMAVDNFMDDVKAILGVHNFAIYDSGSIYLKDGGVMFAGEGFKIKVNGEGGHGSTPHLAKDAMLAASNILIALQKIVSTEIDAQESAVVTVGKFSSGTRANIIVDYAEMAGTYRCYTKKVENKIKEAIVRIAENTASVYGVTAEVEFSMYVPAVMNNAEVGKIIKGSAQKIVAGDEKVLEAKSLTSSDDFAYFTHKAPGYYAFVGSGIADESKRYSLHSSYFVIDEKALETTAALYAQFAVDFLNS